MRTVNRIKLKKLRKLILCLAALLLMSALQVFAETYDYVISDADFIDRTESEKPAVVGTWTEAQDKTYYTVRLYKGEKCLSRRVVKQPEIDFSSVMIMKTAGSGTYTFTVTTTKGGNTIESDTLEVTSQMISLMRSRILKERKSAIAESGGGWVKGPGDIWTYYDSTGDQVKSRWLEVNGHRYYFDSNGIMLTGWHYLNNKYYYFEPKGTAAYPMGAMWRSATTPDGHQVDENGARIGDLSTAPEVSEKILTSLSIYLKEQQNPGEYSKLLDISCSRGTVSNISYSSDPNTWTGNTVGVVTFDVKIEAGLKTLINMKLNCSRASSCRVLSRTSDTMRIELHYIPRYLLKAPENFSINSEGRISWDKVTKASSYQVTVISEEEDSEGSFVTKSKAYTVDSPHFSLNDHGYFEDELVDSIYVQAVGANKKLVTSSSAAKVPDLSELRSKYLVDGEFIRNSEGLKYRDENGDLVTGWKEIGSSWYYFRKNGYAVGPGWYQDQDLYWYYFDENCRMQTGTITVNGVVCRLNDGSNPSLPLGALIQ